MKNGHPIHEQYSRWFYESECPLDLTWMGVPIVKCPYDLHMYQEIIHETRPDLIIETGAFLGGSALYLAQVFDALGSGSVLSIDIEKDRPLPNHPRIDWLLGASSTDPAVLAHVEKAADGKRCMVILDSLHTREHVLKEMKKYSRFVSKGCYMIVEDTNVHGYSYAVGHELDRVGGPAEAVKEFQPRNHGFEVDRRPERLGMSQNPSGYLRRVR